MKNKRPSRLVVALFAVSTLLLALSHDVTAQGSSANDLGNGGIHTIQGRLYTTSGRRSSTIGLRIRLINFASNELSVVADGNGTFIFRYLLPGSYRVVVEGGDLFEDVTENVTIDDPGSSTLSSTIRLRGGARTANVQITLKPKPSSAEHKNGPAAVVSARLAAVPREAIDLYEASLKSVEEKDDIKAMEQLRAAIAIHNEFAAAWNGLGVLLARAGKSDESLDAFARAVRFDNDLNAAVLNYGAALTDARKFPEAEKYLAVALSRDVNQFRGHYYMGITQMNLGRLDIAEQALLKAIELDGRNAMAHYYLGGVFWAERKYRKAADQLEKYLDLDPAAADASKVRQSVLELRAKKE